MDLSPIEQPIIALAGVVVTAAAGWLAQRVAAYLGIKKNDAAMQSFDAALTRAVQAGASGAQGLIKQKGWDHVDVKNAVIAAAAPIAIARFAPALASIGLDPSDPHGATTAYVTAELNRVFPTAMTGVAASPVTPPTPPATAPANSQP